jgi:hypothetical protein
MKSGAILRVKDDGKQVPAPLPNTRAALLVIARPADALH